MAVALPLPQPATGAHPAVPGPVDAFARAPHTKGMNRQELVSAYQAHVSHVAHLYHQAMDNHGAHTVVVHSGTLQKKSGFDDQYWSLRPVPHFQHWAPLAWPDCALVIERGKAARLLAWEDKSFWERWAQPDWAFLQSGLDVVHLADVANVRQHLAAGRVAFVGEDTSRAELWGVDPQWVNPADLVAELDEARVFKTRYEQMCLEEANRVAAAGHARVARDFFAGERSELALHLAFLAETQQDDPDTPYKNIVALGPNAAILHHVSYRRDRPHGDQSLLLDAGATFHGYAADITRTHVTHGSAGADLFHALALRMDDLQLALCRNATVGRNYQDLHDEAHVLLGHVLQDLGVVEMEPQSMADAGVTRLFLPHGLGHSLGLQCHDVGCAKVKPRDDNRFLRNTRTIEPGQCFTIEPGIYFVDTLMDELRAGPHGKAVAWKTVDALKAFGGIRVEDDLVVRPGDQPPENLTRAYLT